LLLGKNPFEGRSQSERTEETPLLPEDEARRLPLDEIVVVVDAQMPVRAKRVVYFEDPLFKGIHGAQKGELPFPSAPNDRSEGDAATQSQKSTSEVPTAGGMIEHVDADSLSREHLPLKQKQTQARIPRASVIAEDQRQFEMDFAGQAVLSIDAASADDVGQVEEALGDLDRLEEEIAVVTHVDLGAN